MSAQTRNGFALVAVLWVMAVAAVLAAGAALQGRSTFNAARNRTNAARAYWTAEGCVAKALGAADQALGTATEARRPNVWRGLDVAVDSILGSSASECGITLRSMGSAIDVNGASESMLRKYLVAVAGQTDGDALTDALLDWRDQDSIPRPAGAEAAWYAANGRVGPRNDSLVADEELLLVRGFENRPDVTQNLTVTPSRICLTTAPGPVLAALPGFTDGAVSQLLNDRAANRNFVDLPTFISRVSQTAAESLVVHFSELATVTTIEPQQWELKVNAQVGFPAVQATSVIWLDQYADHVVILQRRTQ